MDAVLYPGSFDPITYGHINIVERALDIFSQVTVLVATNPQKSYLFTPEEKVEMIRQCLRGWARVEVEHTEGLLVDYARRRQIRVAVRGLRAVTDFEGELAMALTNRTLWPEFDTVFLMTRSDYMYLNSSVVRQVAQLGGDISKFVPPAVEQMLQARFGRGG